ncbi:MAG: hypothetical protein KDM91_23070 [Verrucomicrobiae bacterium]|nr:hypothetical protein [Verrucomicrobiae bacterium]
MKSPATRKRSIVQGILVLVIVGIVLICFGGMDSVFRENRTELKLEGRGQNPPIMGIKVPNTAAYSRSEGVDFIVHYISLGGDGGSIGIFVGCCPNRFLENPDYTEAGMVGDRDIEWAEGRLNSEFIAETVIPLYLNPGPEFRGTILVDRDDVHIWATAPRKKTRSSVISMCEGLTLIRPRIAEEAAPVRHEKAVQDKAAEPENYLDEHPSK